MNRNGHRTVLVDAAKELFLRHGHTSVSRLTVARATGLISPACWVHFRSDEQLLLAVLESVVDSELRRHDAALHSPNPRRALWNFHLSAPTELILQFMLLARHEPVFRDPLHRYTERLRATEAEIFRNSNPDDPDDGQPSAEFVTLAVAALAGTLRIDRSLGIDGGHAETTEIVERYVQASATPWTDRE